MFVVEGSLEEFKTYEEAETELLEITIVDDIIEFIDSSYGKVLYEFLHRKNITDFEVWFSEKIYDAIERMKDDLITEYEDEEDD